MTYRILTLDDGNGWATFRAMAPRDSHHNIPDRTLPADPDLAAAGRTR